MSNKKIREEAISRIKELEKEFDLKSDISERFKNGEVLYSSITPKREKGKIQVLSTKREYAKIVEEFENGHKDYLVYHVIETKGADNHVILALLYVSNEEEDWEYERLEGDYIAAYCVNMENPELSEYGDIIIDASSNKMSLIRNDFGRFGIA